MTTLKYVQQAMIGTLALVLAACSAPASPSASPSETGSVAISLEDQLFYTLELNESFGDSGTMRRVHLIPTCDEDEEYTEPSGFVASQYPGLIMTRDEILSPTSHGFVSFVGLEQYTARAWDSSGRELEADQVLVRVASWKRQDPQVFVYFCWESGVIGVPVGADVERVVFYDNGEALVEWNAGHNAPIVDWVEVETDEEVVRVSWKASDPDHDDLMFYVTVVDANGGIAGRTLIGGNEEVTIAHQAIHGYGPFHVTVQASDGIHTAEATSDEFPLPNVHPMFIY